jgi:Bacterial capsule synthesis protein PGA_cap
MSGRHRAGWPVRSARSATALVLALALIGMTIALAIRAAGRDTGDQGASGSPSDGTPTPSPTEPPRVRHRLLIHGTGDVSLDPSYIPAFQSRGFGWAWSGLSGLFRRDDLTVINLECPATDVQDPTTKQFVFRCDPNALPVARSHGVEVANQANNHAYDQGPDGLVDSLERIRRSGLTPVGAGEDQAHALRAASFRLKGWTVAVLGIDEVLDPLDEVAGTDKPGTAAGHDFGLALRAIRDTTSDADVVVVMIHWASSSTRGLARTRWRRPIG